MARTPIHPGEILSDGMEAIGVSVTDLSQAIGVPHNRIGQIMAGKRSVTANTALRLAEYFGTTPDLWLRFQNGYDLDLERQEISEELIHIPKQPYNRGASDVPPTIQA